MKKTIPLLLIIAVGYYFYLDAIPRLADWDNAGPEAVTVDNVGSGEIAAAYRSRSSGVQVGGVGRVSKVLPDDNEGSRHQRFILELESAPTVLIVHNIDLAPRISGLDRGDEVSFYGEYEWNDKGGLVHWTHHDPQGIHVAGWLEHDGRRYQ
jgi:hypothetical protein